MISNKRKYKYMRLFSRIPIIRQIGVYISVLFSSQTILNKNIEERIELTSGYDINRIIKELKKDGISKCIKLNKETVKHILEYINDKPVFALRNPQLGYYLKDQKKMEEKLGKEILLAQYNNIEENNLFSEIVNSPLLLNVAKQYLGKYVKKVGTILWWTFPSNVSNEERIKHAHFFHRDVDDYKFLKIFFYLTDLEKGDGTHVFVKGTHNPGFKEFFNEGFRVKRYTDVQINKRYPEKVFEVLGKSGDGFVEDTLGFHKANTPVKNPRLAFEITYAINDYDIMNDIVSEEKMFINEF